MKALARGLFCALAVGLSAQASVVMAQGTAAETRPAPKASFDKLELQDGDSIVFLGDSITHQVLYTQYVEDWFYTRFPKVRLKFHNAGVGGARAWDALARFDRDVAAYKPKYVTILLGMNDGTYRPYDDATFKTYQQDMKEVLKRITDIGATPILMTPTMYDARAARARPNQRLNPESIELYNSTLAYYGTWLRDVSAENGWGFVDMWTPLNTITRNQRKGDPNFTMIQDAVHPGPAGQLVMAAALLDDVAPAQRQVSTITLNRNAKGELRSGKQSGGALSGLSESDDKIEFTWEAESLPWVVPEEARAAMKYGRIGSRLGAETLRVNGLTAGNWELSIDGTVVGSYKAESLARGVELQGNDKTPQYQQALEVAKLNKIRNSGPYEGENDGPEHLKRNLWGRYQGYARQKRQAEESPDNKDLAAKVEAAGKALENMDELIAKYNAQAKAIEDEIFKINQPKARVYVLKKAGK